MPVKESSATALVRYTGFGIFCLNTNLQMGEIAAVRDDKHLLTVNIKQPVYQDGGENDLIVYRDIATYQNLPKDGVRIEIKATGESAPEKCELYQNGDFDRLTSTDVNDFRWVVNIDRDLHGDTTLRPTSEPSYPLSKIYIQPGLYYACKLDRNLFFEKVETDADGQAARREVFGNVAETIGVKLEGEEVSFTIHIGDREETHLLKRVEHLPRIIEIRNIDYSDNAVYSDMADYYKYLSDPGGKRFDLSPVVEDADDKLTVGDGVNQKQFCHPIGTDLPSIDEL